MNSGIYKITNPNNAIYIGQSKSLKSRLSRYKKLQTCDKQILLYRSFIKYGIENHTFEIVESGSFTKKELNIMEKQYILQFNSFRKYNILGLNLTSGGDSIEFDQSIKDKMSETRIRKFKEGQRNSKIKVEDIYEIKKLIAYNKPLKEIGNKFGVTDTTISEIKANRTWVDIPNYIVPENEKYLINRSNKIIPTQKYSEDFIFQIIKEMFNTDIKNCELSKKYGMNKNTICGIRMKRLRPYLWEKLNTENGL